MKIKGAGARFRAIHDLTQRASRTVAMTATPPENNPMELYTLLKAAAAPGLWPQGVFEREFVTWRTQELGYGKAKQVPVGWQTWRLDEVRSFLAGVLLQRSAEEVGLVLPTLVGETHRLVPLSRAQQEAYNHASKRQGRPDALRRRRLRPPRRQRRDRQPPTPDRSPGSCPERLDHQVPHERIELLRPV